MQTKMLRRKKGHTAILIEVQTGQGHSWFLCDEKNSIYFYLFSSDLRDGSQVFRVESLLTAFRAG